jgi:hypothetical protein
LLAD